MRFSQRQGFTPVRNVIQFESMDEPLRNALWNMMQSKVWSLVRGSTGYVGGYYVTADSNRPHFILCQGIWSEIFILPIDELPDDWSSIVRHMKDYFFRCKWYEAFDFVEFVQENFPVSGFDIGLRSSANLILEQHMSAYRFVNGLLSPLTNNSEISEIERAISDTKEPEQIHLRRALELISDDENPDFRNSIKESISAVESLCLKVCGRKSGTLGQLIKEIEDKTGMHASFKVAISALYGYASDESGIRHALLEDEISVDFEDAKFMLVLCSAFINLVKGKLM